MVVGSGTTTVWCGVTFVPNLLLLLFLQSIGARIRRRSRSCAMWMGVAMRSHNRAPLKVSYGVVVVLVMVVGLVAYIYLCGLVVWVLAVMVVV